MRSIKLLTLLAITSLLISLSCAPEDDANLQTEVLDLPSVPYVYPTGTHAPTLGRVLFYDRKLSLNNSVSCASCHKQTLAFSDNARFSEGFEMKRTTRNSMPIQNLGSGFFTDSLNSSPFPGPGFFVSPLFWDGRETNLQSMVTKPIVNHIEMGYNDLDDLAEKLESIPYYEELFWNAYQTNDITPDLIADALTTFVASINSKTTKIDLVNRGMASLTALEEKGRELFTTTYECNTCHQVDNPSGYLFVGTFANVGLEAQYQDPGLAAVTKNPLDVGRFKIPSLRNVVLTAPYMHDGRFETLEDVLDHYSEGVQDNPGLDFRLRDASGAPLKREIPVSDKKAIIAFLNTLTDHQMITDARFSNPFKVQ